MSLYIRVPVSDVSERICGVMSRFWLTRVIQKTTWSNCLSTSCTFHNAQCWADFDRRTWSDSELRFLTCMSTTLFNDVRRASHCASLIDDRMTRGPTCHSGDMRLTSFPFSLRMRSADGVTYDYEKRCVLTSARRRRCDRWINARRFVALASHSFETVAVLY